MSKKDKAFELFDEGKTTSSPEVKELKLKGATRYNYYAEWQKAGGVASPSPKAISEAKVKGKVVSELKMIAEPKEEVNEEEEKVNEEGEGEKEEEEEEKEPPESKEKPKEKPSTDGKKSPPTMVAGQGLTFAITISTKTLMLYQLAATYQDDELTLGDFIDTCVEDTYLGRGLDLGLVKTGGE